MGVWLEDCAASVESSGAFDQVPDGSPIDVHVALRRRIDPLQQRPLAVCGQRRVALADLALPGEEAIPRVTGVCVVVDAVQRAVGGIPAAELSCGMIKVRTAQGRYDEAAAIATRLLQREFAPEKDSPYEKFLLREMLWENEIARGDPERTRHAYRDVEQVARQYGFMDALNVKRLAGIASPARRD